MQRYHGRSIRGNLMFKDKSGVKWFKTEEERRAYIKNKDVEADIKSIQEEKEEKKNGKKSSK